MKIKTLVKSIIFTCILLQTAIGFANEKENALYFQQQLENITKINSDVSDQFQSLKFLSYNIQLKGLDIRGHLWEERKFAVCTLISYADVIVLQEITHDQLVDLTQMLPNYFFIGFNTVTGKDLIIPSSNIQEGLVVAFRKDLFVLKSTEIGWYSDTPNIPSQKWGQWTSAFPKALQKATLIFLANGKEIDIFNSHFAHDEDLSGNINPRILSSQYELQLLKELKGRYWISAGDRNFHYPRDLSAYNLYLLSAYVTDSKLSASLAWDKTTFLGYEDHPRINPITTEGEFEKYYYLDVIFHNPEKMQSRWWLSHIGEYSDELILYPVGPCKSSQKRQFASDHSAIFVEYLLF